MMDLIKIMLAAVWRSLTSRIAGLKKSIREAYFSDASYLQSSIDAINDHLAHMAASVRRLEALENSLKAERRELRAEFDLLNARIAAEEKYGSEKEALRMISLQLRVKRQLHELEGVLAQAMALRLEGSLRMWEVRCKLAIIEAA